VQRPLAISVAILAFGCASATAAPTVIQAKGSASITFDPALSAWTIASAGTALALTAGPGVDFAVAQFVTTSKTPWSLAATPDTTVIANGVPRLFGSRQEGFVCQEPTTTAMGTLLRLDATCDLRNPALRVTRHYAVVSGSPTIETWTTYEALGAAVYLSTLSGLQLALPQGTVHWVSGLQGDNADVEHDSAFTRKSKQLAAGDHLTLGATGR
jgi:hypothetical protein